MIAVDTNILVYAHREDSSFHKAAFPKIKELAESTQDWSIPWPCVYEFLAIVTHSRIYKKPTPLKIALEQVQAWSDSPTLYLLGDPQKEKWKNFQTLFLKTNLSGAKIHDAKIAVICLHHEVDVFWTADRDFSRLPWLKIQNPLM